VRPKTKFNIRGLYWFHSYEAFLFIKSNAKLFFVGGPKARALVALRLGRPKSLDCFLYGWKIRWFKKNFGRWPAI